MFSVHLPVFPFVNVLNDRVREDEPLIPFHILPLVLDNTGNKKSYKILNYSGTYQQAKRNGMIFFLLSKNGKKSMLMFLKLQMTKNYNGCNTE